MKSKDLGKVKGENAKINNKNTLTLNTSGSLKMDQNDDNITLSIDKEKLSEDQIVGYNRKVNNKTLGNDISINYEDVGAAAEGHKHAAGDITSGILSKARGGTGNANGTADTLTTARNVQVNLASTSKASFNGSADISPGVTGVLPIANGGTGATTAAGALTNLGAAPAHSHDWVYLGLNPITSTTDDTVRNWSAKGTGYCFYSEDGQLIDQPAAWGVLISIRYVWDIFQIWNGQPAGPIYTRSGNYSGWSGTWKKVFNSTMTIPVANGGTGATTRKGAFNNLSHTGIGPISLEDDIPSKWVELGSCYCCYGDTDNALTDQPSHYGILHSIVGTISVSQIWACLDSGRLYKRHGKGDTWAITWTEIFDETKVIPIENGGTGNQYGYIRTGVKSGTSVSATATVEGTENTGSGTNCHAEGSNTVASGDQSHSEGHSTIASSPGSHAEGYCTKATGCYSHSEGSSTQALELASHAEGWYTIASGQSSHAEGYNTTASGYQAHAEGYNTTASGIGSHASGWCTNINGNYAAGFGKFNKSLTSCTTANDKTGDAFVIGNGTSDSTTDRSNCFRVMFNGAVYGLTSFKTTGADYSEYFEWTDNNEDNEDRVGHFVTLDEDKIRYANEGEYILGIISGQPCIIGNADEDWLGRWEHDEFGRFIQVEVESPVTELREVEVKDDNGNTHMELQEFETGEVVKGYDYKQNPEYDGNQPYIERSERKEWDPVGLLGVLSVIDDGTCDIDGYCKCINGGIASKADTYIPGMTYRVIKRVTNNIIKVIFR